MAGGNPFATDQKEDLLGGVQRSDAVGWEDQEQREGQQEQASSGGLSRRRAVAAPSAADAAEGRGSATAAAIQPEQQQDTAPPLPPPPPLVAAPIPMATQPPPAGPSSAAHPPTAYSPGVVPGSPYSESQAYYSSAPGAAGAWGSSGGGQYGSSTYGAPPPPPPGAPIEGGMYYPQPAAPVGAWSSSHPADQPLSYIALEQQHGGDGVQPPLGRMACGGVGEQWVCFLVGLLVWPLWYVASIWYCTSTKQRADPRQRTPFILNCIGSFLFSLIWMAILARNTWNCNGATGACW